MIVYLHGFNSSAASGKAQQTAVYCGEHGVDCVVPTLHHHPNQAVEQVRVLLATPSDRPHTLIGSSMGGFFATYFCEQDPQLRAVLINPAVDLADKLVGEVGQRQENYSTTDTYVFSDGHYQALVAMNVSAVTHLERYWLMVQMGDEVLDYREAVGYYQGARHSVEEGGDHGFVDYQKHLPAIVEFALG